jgi:hypothetical protein
MTLLARSLPQERIGARWPLLSNVSCLEVRKDEGASHAELIQRKAPNFDAQARGA